MVEMVECPRKGKRVAWEHRHSAEISPDELQGTGLSASPEVGWVHIVVLSLALSSFEA